MTEDQATRRVTAVDLVGQRSPLSPAVAPDGERVAFAVSEVDFTRSEIRSQVWAGPEPEGPQTRFGARQLTRALADASAPAFSPDGASLAVITFRPQPHEDEEDDRNEEGVEKHQVYLLLRDGGDAVRITERAEGVDAFRWLSDGSGVVTLGRAHRPPAERAYRRQRRDNLDDANVVHGDIAPFEIWTHPLQGRARRVLPAARGIEGFDISPDGRLLAYATNHTGRPDDIDRTEIVLRDLETGEERRLTGGRGGSESGPRFSRDGRFVLFHGWADPAIAFSRQELFAVRVDDGSFALVPLMESIDRDMEDFAPLGDGRVAVIAAWGLESRLVILDPETRAHEIVPLEGKVLTSVATAVRGDALALVAEDARSLPDVYLVDLASGDLSRVSDLHPEAEEWRLAQRRRVSWESEGYRHEGLLLLPAAEDAKGGPPPLVVWIHGGPHWRVIDTLQVDEAEALAAEGYAVFLPQYRGSSGHSEDYALASRGDLGGADARDVLAGVDAVIAAGLVDASRMAVAGASYGGYLANWLVATTKRFRAAVSIAGIFDLTHDYSTSDYASWETQYLGAPPWESPELYRERSPLTHAAAIEAPVLILHGLEDETSFFTNSKGLYRALTELGRTTELVLYPREGHGLFEPAHRVDAVHRILDWLDRWVAPGARSGAVHVAGRSVRAPDGRLTLTPMGHAVRRDYAGVRPAHGRVFLEVSLLLRVEEGGQELIRLLPCGTSSDVVLTDELGDLYRPVGVPLTTQEQPVLFAGRGALEAWSGEDGLPPSLPVTVTFEVPDWPGQFRLSVLDLPPVTLEVMIEPETPDEQPAEEPAEASRTGDGEIAERSP